MIDPYLEACELRRLTTKREVRPREVAELFLGRIERLNPKLGAFMTVSAERALDDAMRLEELKQADAEKLPLYGVAYSLKDLTWTRGIRTTMGSKNYANFMPRADAELAVRLRGAGGVLLGKTTTPEFGGRPTTEGGLCPPARNPWDPAHTAGGSSGGAAAAVAAGLGPLAEGTDGGGSIRIPAACCGVVGLKPSRGRISFAPVQGEAWAGFATHGPIARSVRDVALMLDVMAGPVVGDPYWAERATQPFSAAVERRPRKLRLAAMAETSLSVVDSETGAAFASACEVFRAMGHEVEELRLDPAPGLLDPARTIICAGISSIPVAETALMDPVVGELRDRGLKIIAAEYINAVLRMHNRARALVQQLDPYDALLTPTLTRPAMALGSFPADGRGYIERELWTWIAFTFPFNATGQPAFSLPNGFTRAGLPIGLQIVGRPQDEAGIIALAAQFEEARPWRELKPALD